MASVHVQVRYDPGSGTVVVWCRTCGVVVAKSTVGLQPAMEAFLLLHSSAPCVTSPELEAVAAAAP